MVPAVRWRPHLLAGLLLLQGVAPAVAQHERSPVLAGRLDNGLEVIVAPSGTVPLATIEIVVRNGAFTQLTPEEEGLPHLLEHMLFRGGGDFSREVSELDGVYNGTTSAEAVTYYLTVPSVNLDKAIEVMADLVRDPDFRVADLRDEQRVVTNELERAASDPYYLFRFYQDLHLWGEASPRKTPAGTLYGVQRATTRSLRDYYDRFYLPNNAALIITGAVEPEAAFASAQDHFGRWDDGDDPFETLSLPGVPRLVSDTVFVLPEDASDVTFAISWQGPSSHENRTHPVVADVLTTIANSPAGPFRGALVDSGRFHEITVSYEHLNHVGPFTLVARTTPDQLPTAVYELQGLLEGLAEPGFFTSDHIEAAKARLRLGRAFLTESVTTLSHQIADDWSVAGTEYFTGYAAALEAVTAADLQAFAQRYLGEGRRVVGLLVSQATIAAHQDVLVASLDGWIRP